MEINNKGFSVYSDLLKASPSKKRQTPNIDFVFDYFPKISLSKYPAFSNQPFIAEFYLGNSLFFSDKIYCGMFSNIFPRWVDDWKMTVRKENGDLMDSFSFLDKIKTGNVRLTFDTSSLGDNIAFMGYVQKFVNRYQIRNLTVSTFYNQLFRSEYPDIKFEIPNYYPEKHDINIGLGWYDEDDRNIHKKDPRTIPLQQVSSDILGVDYAGDIRPKIVKKLYKRPSDKKYICIATESTAGAKYWHYPGGWQNLIDMLISIGFDVVVIQQQENNYSGVIDRTGDLPLEDRISDLLQCEFFIGLGSGLSWLAWSAGVPVVLISGFSQPFCEFSDKTLRIINKNVCHGCFNNPKYKFDKSWWWCPEHAGTDRQFECTTSITPKEILDAILNWEHFLLPNVPSFNKDI